MTGAHAIADLLDLLERVPGRAPVIPGESPSVVVSLRVGASVQQAGATPMTVLLRLSNDDRSRARNPQ